MMAQIDLDNAIFWTPPAVAARQREPTVQTLQNAEQNWLPSAFGSGIQAAPRQANRTNHLLASGKSKAEAVAIADDSSSSGDDGDSGELSGIILSLGDGEPESTSNLESFRINSGEDGSVGANPTMTTPDLAMEPKTPLTTPTLEILISSSLPSPPTTSSLSPVIYEANSEGSASCIVSSAPGFDLPRLPIMSPTADHSISPHIILQATDTEDAIVDGKDNTSEGADNTQDILRGCGQKQIESPPSAAPRSLPRCSLGKRKAGMRCTNVSGSFDHHSDDESDNESSGCPDDEYHPLSDEEQATDEDAGMNRRSARKYRKPPAFRRCSSSTVKSCRNRLTSQSETYCPKQRTEWPLSPRRGRSRCSHQIGDTSAGKSPYHLREAPNYPPLESTVSNPRPTASFRNRSPFVMSSWTVLWPLAAFKRILNGLCGTQAPDIASTTGGRKIADDINEEDDTATVDEWALPNTRLKRVINSGQATFQLEFSWPSCSKHQYKTETKSQSSRANYTADEDALIVELRRQGLPWEDVHRHFTKQFPGRSKGSVTVRYSKLRLMQSQ